MVVVLATGCGSREFPSEQETVGHFRAHRLQFAQAAELFLSSLFMNLDIPEVPSPHGESGLVRLSRELRVLNIARVPGVESQNEQWVEFKLAQHLLPSRYGILYVPEGHEGACQLITFMVRSPPHGIRVIRPIEGRWFYFDYD